ncbi:hypothetical protein [Nocardia abscessus]|uniref:hypothetical protein n=1 Tax=Nocardia abscessus TaxID=120957 RepID=UPI002453857B|nr:hypothetical protein [Nocardia abscessus]
MRPRISLVHRAMIARAVEDYAPEYTRGQHHPNAAAAEAARAVTAYDLAPLTRRYGRRAVAAAALETIRRNPQILERPAAECATAQHWREHLAEHLAAAAVRAYLAADHQRAALLLEDAETVNPRYDWSGYRAMATAPAPLAEAV